MAILEQTPPSLSSKGTLFNQDEGTFMRKYKEHIKHAKEVLEVSRRHLPVPEADQICT